MSTIEVAPDLPEEALFQLFERGAASVAPDERAQWLREREALYASQSSADRERAFRSHARRWCERLDLVRPVREALAACPAASRALASVHVRGVARSRDEGSELYARAGVAPRLVLGALAETMADPPALHALALREVVYADDMLAPEFGFQPSLPDDDAGLDGARAELLRDRFRVLWEARVRGRMQRIRGQAPAHEPPARFLAAFGAALPREELSALFERVSSESAPAFAELVRSAALLRERSAAPTK